MKKLEKENSGKEEPLFERKNDEKLIEENLTEEEIENLTKAGYSRDQIAWVGKQKASSEKFGKKITYNSWNFNLATTILVVYLFLVR